MSRTPTARRALACSAGVLLALAVGCGERAPVHPDATNPGDAAGDVARDTAAEANVPEVGADGGADAMDAPVDGDLDAPGADAGGDDALADGGDDALDAGADAADPLDGGADADAADPLDAGPDDRHDVADAGAPDDASDGAPADGSAALVVRVVAANLTTGDDQSYTPGEGIRILQGLRPDVTLLQEFKFRSNTPADLRAFVDEAFGPGFEYVRGPTGAIPNGVISRYPIVASGTWTDPRVTDRGFTWARIDVPGPGVMFAISLHLISSSTSGRNASAVALLDQVRGEVPAGDLLVLGGDLNTQTRTEPCVATLGGRVVTAPPYPADQLGNDNTNQPRNRPYDWVLVDPTLDALEVPVAIGANRFPHGLVFDSEFYMPLADVAPVRATDSNGPSMQHMAVVRDFRLPE